MSANDLALSACGGNRAQILELSLSPLRASAAGLNTTQLPPEPAPRPGQQPGGPVPPANTTGKQLLLEEESNIFQSRMSERPLFTAGLTAPLLLLMAPNQTLLLRPSSPQRVFGNTVSSLPSLGTARGLGCKARGSSLCCSLQAPAQLLHANTRPVQSLHSKPVNFSALPQLTSESRIATNINYHRC